MPSIEKKIIIVPDVHGRDAWKKVIPYANKEDYKIIFLGDYHDPYPHEGITPDVSIIIWDICLETYAAAGKTTLTERRFPNFCRRMTPSLM